MKQDKSQVEKADSLREQARKIAESFNAIKKNPMNLNLLMAHIGLISMTLDRVLNDMADNISPPVATEEEVKDESTHTVN